MITPELRNYLAVLRKRARMQRVVATGLRLGMLAAAIVCAMPLCGWGIGGAALRGGLVAVGVTAFVSIVALDLVLPLRKLRDDDHVALLAPVTAREGLLGAVDLECAALAGRATAFSPALLLAHARRAMERAAAHPLSSALPHRRLAGAALASVSMLVGAGICTALWPDAIVRGARSLGPPLLTTEARAASEDGPIVGDLSLEYTFPDYMTEPAIGVPSTSGEISAPRGTLVRIRTRSLRPVSTGSLVMESGQTLPLRVQGDRELDGQLLVTKQGRYAFRLRHADGSAVRERGWRAIRIEEDQSPIVTLTAPEADLEVDPAQTVAFAFDLHDDHGLKELALVFKVGEEPETRRTVRSFEAHVQDASGEAPLAMQEVRLEGEESVAVRLEALDRDTVSGPNRGASRTVTLRVASPASRHMRLLEDQKELLDSTVLSLADRLELPVPEDAPAARARGRFDQTRRGTERILAIATRLEEDLAADTLSQRDVWGQIGAMRERLAELLSREWRLYDGSVAPRLRRVELDRESVRELEDDALLVEDLLGRQRLDALAELGRDVQRGRDRLASLLEQFGRSRSEQVRQELLKELERLEAKARELYGRLAEMRREIPEEFLNRDALRAIDLGGELGRLRESLADDDVPAARAALDRLNETMRELMAALEGNASAYRGERFAAEERARSELVDRVADLERRQRDLSRLTRAVQERFRRQMGETMRTRIDPLVQRLSQRVRAAAQGLRSANGLRLAQAQREVLARSRQRISDLEASLAQGDLDEAAAMADHAVGRLTELDELLAPPRAATREVARAVHEAIPPIRSVRHELLRAMPDARAMLGSEDEERLRRQAGSQRTLSEDASRLSRRIGRPQAGLSFLARDAQRLLEESRQQMGQASDDLSRASPRPAFEAQERALERLRRLRETLEDAGSPTKLPGVAQRTPPVRIPGPEDHRVPRELRRLLLDAMRESSPERYDEEVRRYYEGLVR